MLPVKTKPKRFQSNHPYRIKKVYTVCFYIFTTIESFEFRVNMQCPVEGFLPSVVCVGPCWAEQGRSNKSPGYGSQACGRWMMDLSARVHNGGTEEHWGEGQNSALSP